MVMRYKNIMRSNEVADPVMAELDSINERLENLYNVVALQVIAIILIVITIIVMRCLL